MRNSNEYESHGQQFELILHHEDWNIGVSGNGGRYETLYHLYYEGYCDIVLSAMQMDTLKETLAAVETPEPIDED